MKLEIDQIGPWSEIKLDIIREYATAYSQILSAQKKTRLKHVYIDAFAGAGIHISKTSKQFIPGSPLNALNVLPPFYEYHFVDIDHARVEALEKAGEQRSDVNVYYGDCNYILLKEIFPKVKYSDFCRGLCLLDPYGLHLDWDVIFAAGQMKSIEIFLNFPTMDMNMNVLKQDPEKVMIGQGKRMTKFWGDESWKSLAYTTSGNLFGYPEKTDNDTMAQGFRERLLNIAGFKYVSQPLAMRNSRGAVLYYLFFASPKPVAVKIVKDIFYKYEKNYKW